MAKREKARADENKKKRSGTPVTVWLKEDLVEALDGFTETQRPRASRTAHIEAAIEEYLRSRGAWPGTVD